MLTNTSLHCDHSAEMSLKNEETMPSKPRETTVENRLELALRESSRLMDIDFKSFRDKLLLIQQQQIFLYSKQVEMNCFASTNEPEAREEQTKSRQFQPMVVQGGRR